MIIKQNTISKYTKNGCRLVLRKTTNAPLPILKNRIPKDAVFMDYVNVETHFGKGKTQIVTYRDKNKQIIQRIFLKTSPHDKVKIISNYENAESPLQQELTKIREQNPKIKITTVKFVNSKQKQKIITEQRLEKKLHPHLSRDRLILDYNDDNTIFETQIIEKLAPHSRRIYLKTSALKINNVLTNKKVEGNIENIKQISKSPFLFFRNYDDKDFLTAVFEYGTKTQKVSERKIKMFIKHLNGKIRGVSHDDKNQIDIDLYKIAKDKVQIIETVIHELRHQYQNKILERNSLFAKILKFFGIETPEYILFARANANYVPSDVNFKKYHENYLEADAREQGYKAGNLYKQLESMLIIAFNNSMSKLLK